ncbi:MAG: response regulator [Alphaproteobacteria bacterium]|nr:response regulator [Alphaproteobacteria bacterium]
MLGERVDLVLTDAVMSGTMKGLDLGRRILQTREDLPVIICSGLDTHSLPDMLQASDRCVVLSKPYALAEMARAIRRLLDAGGVR